MCTDDLIVLHPLGIFIFYFLFFSEKNPVDRGSNSRPNVSEGYEVTILSYRGDLLHETNSKYRAIIFIAELLTNCGR